MSLKKYSAKVKNISLDDVTLSFFDAIKDGNTAVVEHILKHHGAELDLNEQDENGCTCLGWAAQEGSISLTKRLVKAGASVNTSDFYGQTALHFAAEFGQDDVAKFLIERGANVDWMDVNNDGLSAIHIAACKGSTQVAYSLIDAGCNVNAQDIKGVSVLHCAVANHHHNIAKALLKAGARPNLVGKITYRTPLFLACEVGDLAMAQMLIDHGAKLNMQDNYGLTPLCAVCIQDNTAMAELLIHAGSKVTIADEQKSLPIHYTARNSNVHLTTMLLDYGSPIDCLNQYSEGPLHSAVRMGHMDIVRLLVKRGADVNLCVPRQGRVTPLHVAVDVYTEVPAFTEVLQLLIEGDCDLNLPAHSSQESPVHRAMKQGHTGIVLTLLQHGADPSISNSVGDTLVHTACSRGDCAVIETLLFADCLSDQGNEWLQTMEFQIRPRLLPYFVKDFPWTTTEVHSAIIQQIAEHRRNPMSLMRLARVVIRRALGERRHVKVPELGLPPRMEEFIMLRIL